MSEEKFLGEIPVEYGGHTYMLKMNAITQSQVVTAQQNHEWERMTEAALGRRSWLLFKSRHPTFEELAQLWERITEELRKVT